MSSSSDEEAHRRLVELIGAHVLGGLEPEQDLALRAHLDRCASCRAEVAELAPLAEALRLSDPQALGAPATPPPELGAALGGQVAAERVLRDRRRRRDRAARLLGAAAAAVLLVGSTAVVVTSLADEPAVVAALVPTEPVALEPARPGVGVTSAVLVPHTWGVELTVVMTGLTPGERYRAVALARDGARLPAGEFLGVDQLRGCDLQAALLREDTAGFLVLDAQGRTVASASLPA